MQLIKHVRLGSVVLEVIDCKVTVKFRFEISEILLVFAVVVFLVVLLLIVLLIIVSVIFVVIVVILIKHFYHLVIIIPNFNQLFRSPFAGLSRSLPHSENLEP